MLELSGVQVADLIDVALQKAKCLHEQWFVPRSMSESCISVNTSGKYVANFFCQDGIKAYRSLGLESRENAIIFRSVGATGSVKA